MDRLFCKSESFSHLETILKAVNQTTDDIMFLYDFQNDSFQFYTSMENSFSLFKPDKSSPPCFRDLLDTVHPTDRKLLIEDRHRILEGHRDFHNINFRMIKTNGQFVWLNSRAKVLYGESNTPLYLLGRFSEEAVRHLFNPITGLWNKTKLREDLKKKLSATTGWMMKFQIPSLAAINLGHGKNYGDHLLCQVADLLEEIDCVEESYHVDPNSFVLLLNLTSENEVGAMFEDLCKNLQDKCSLFAGAIPTDGRIFTDVSQMIDSVNLTLKKAMKNSITRLEFFSVEEVEQRISALTLLEDMKASVQNGFTGFEVVYQPQIKSESYDLYGVEALLRYHSPKRGKIFPDEFIPILEQSGLIDTVGMWVLETALTQCKEWRKHIPTLQVAVNFSSVQFEDAKLSEKIVERLNKVDLPGSALTVELTESVQLSTDNHYFNRIKQIKSYGIRFSIDDFGTGYSNLGYLKKLDVNEIKIDRSFITAIEKNTYNYRLISNLIEFAKTNAINACCEGVETPKELTILEPLQADYFQGYLFDRPCTVVEIEQKYIQSDSKEYKARLEALDEVYRFKEQNGALNFDPKTILRQNNIGLWIIRNNKSTNRYELHTDNVMEQVLGLTEKLSPAECFDFWYRRIPEEEKERVVTALKTMSQHKNKAIQMEYRWLHPALGEVKVRSSGISTKKENNVVVLEGYHRILTGVEQA